MARRWNFTNDLSVGEIAPEFLMRTDATVRNRAAKQARNVRLLPGGGFERRWGTVDLAALPGDTRLEVIGYGPDDAKILAFSAGEFRYFGLDGTLIYTLAGCPWSASDLRGMQVAIEFDRAVVTSHSFYPQLLTRIGATWVREAFPFAAGLAGSLLQPYYRFADRDLSISPSGYSGAITVTASAAVFVPAHVGARIRYTEIEMLVTGYTSPTVVSATVIGNLYPTVDVTVASSIGFLVGQVVSGLTSEIQGVVAAVPNGVSVTVQLTGGYTYFDTTEKLTGPTSTSTISAVTLNGTPAASLDWDEPLISNARGYPGACALHRTRLLLSDFPNAANVLAASAVGDITDYDVGTGADSDAIVERIGRDSTLRIKHFGSAEQLLIFTEAGPYYVPEQVGAPLSPTNLEILRIGPEVAGTASPILVSEGMVFSEQASGRTMIAIPTGNVRRSWDTTDMSELAFHLAGTPVELEIQPATSQSDRLVHSLRDDGQLSAVAYRRSDDTPGWALWTTTGAWRSIAVADGDLYMVARRTINGVDTYRLERMNDGTWGDGVVRIATPATAVTAYAFAVVSVWKDSAKLGEFGISGLGVLQDPDGLLTGLTNLDVGFDFPWTVELVPPVDVEYGTSRKLRICRAYFDVISTMPFSANGFIPGGFAAPNLGGAIAPFTGRVQCALMGHRFDATLTVSQLAGGPTEMRSITMEVTS